MRKFFNIKPDGMLYLKPEESMQNTHLGQALVEQPIIFSVYASGISYAVIEMVIPNGLSVIEINNEPAC